MMSLPRSCAACGTTGYRSRCKQTLIDMGIERCIELKQAMLDRYLSR